MLIAFLGLAVPGVGLVLWARSASATVLETSLAIEPPPRIIEPPVSKARGEHLVRNVLDCAGCHGDDLAGHKVFDHWLLGRFYAPNLTSGQGGVGAQLDTNDWDRAIRHGVDRDGLALLYHPSRRYSALSDQDLEAATSYLRDLPPISQDMLDSRPGPLFRLLVALGWLELDAHAIDHGARVIAPEPGASGEYGKYLAQISGCIDCHGSDLAGRPGPPGAPAAPAIHSEALQGWRLDDLSSALRDGVGSDGQPLDPYMPYRTYSGMTDPEVDALWRYLKYTGTTASQ